MKNKIECRGVLVLFLLFLLLEVSLVYGESGANATSPSPPVPPVSQYSAKFNPSMAVIIVILISAFFFMGLFSVYIRQCAGEEHNSRAIVMANGGSIRSRRTNGLHPDVIEMFPTFTYSIVKDLKIGKAELECAVCLNEFEDDESLRLLPKCDHVFHPKCIDLWLVSHITCPVCRSNLDPRQSAETTVINVSESDHTSDVSIHVNEEGSSRDVEVINPSDFPVPNRPTRTGPIQGKFPRSHSTGHSLVPPGECCERFTLRLPGDVRKYILNTMVVPVSSGDGSVSGGSSHRGYRTGGGEGSSRGKSYQFRRLEPQPSRRAKSDRWMFFTRTASVKSTSPKRPAIGIQLDVSVEPEQLTELRTNLNAEAKKRADLEFQLTRDRKLREKELNTERQARLTALKRHEDQMTTMQIALEALQNTQQVPPTRGHNQLPETSRVSTREKLGPRGVTIQSEASRGHRISARQEEEQGPLHRVPSRDRLSKGAGTYHPQPTRPAIQPTRHYVTKEHMDQRIKKLIKAQVLGTADDITKLQGSPIAKKLFDMEISKEGLMFKYIVDLESYKDGSYKKQLEVVQVDDQDEEKHLYHMHHNNMIEINQITNSNRSKRRRLSECCDLTPQDNEAKLLPESSNRRLGISFEDCGTSHVKFPHHDALVIMPKMKKFIIHTMMIDTRRGIEILFQSTIDQMGLTDQVIQSDTDISGFNGSKEEQVGKIILPITAGPATVDVVFYVISVKSRYLRIMGHCWIHNIEAIASTYHQALRFKHNNGNYEIRGSQKLSQAC
ncbi:hypothetical protein GIB67_005700 [Kingdonia uniflora]|uniref:RING-type E3 ubiquitin transferase n=1 Tax=Kingdonia uniflora TaxID=39325 RepID=A0A7J7NIM2_9MAGN|nr:hypothetical protein GIB67_005700 [Kingdonia uniflora]